jgi:hypothetical protein
MAVAVGFAVAFALSFVLNRVLNFRSHDPVGRQTIVYVGIVALNFAILVGVSSGLEAVGVQYQVARVAAPPARGPSCTAPCAGSCSAERTIGRGPTIAHANGRRSSHERRSHKGPLAVSRRTNSMNARAATARQALAELLDSFPRRRELIVEAACGGLFRGVQDSEAEAVAPVDEGLCA